MFQIKALDIRALLVVYEQKTNKEKHQVSCICRNVKLKAT